MKARNTIAHKLHSYRILISCLSALQLLFTVIESIIATVKPRMIKWLESADNFNKIHKIQLAKIDF